jgi:hypothetical protein
MVRETSIEAYNRVKESGYVGRKQKEVYHVVFYYGPMTSAECYAKMRELWPSQYLGITVLTQSRARFTELREMGLLQEVGKRKCKVTRNTVLVWDVTNRFPVPLKKDVKVSVPPLTEKDWKALDNLYEKGTIQEQAALIRAMNIAKSQKRVR